jgi:hypothetical protein
VRDAERFAVLLPPLELQKSFGRCAQQIRAATDRMEAEARRLEGLFASIEHRAFRGEL